MKRRLVAALAAAGAVLVLAGCSAPVEGVVLSKTRYEAWNENVLVCIYGSPYPGTPAMKPFPCLPMNKVRHHPERYSLYLDTGDGERREVSVDVDTYTDAQTGDYYKEIQ